MTYVSPLQRKVDLYLDLINQGVPQNQALQQVGASLEELSASGLDLRTSADITATITAADLQLDNYRREQIRAAQQGLPPPPPPPGYSLSEQTTTSILFSTDQPAVAQADSLGLNLVSSPEALPAQPVDNRRFLTDGVNATAPPVSDSNFTTGVLTPGLSSVVGSPEPLPTGAGTLSQAELQSGVIARTFTANENYQAIQSNNAQRRQILEEYAIAGKSTAEAYSDPRFRALVADANQLSQNVQAGSVLEPVTTYQNSPLLQQRFPVTFESSQQLSPTELPDGTTPTGAIRSIGSSPVTVTAFDDTIIPTPAQSLTAPVTVDPSNLTYNQLTDLRTNIVVAPLDVEAQESTAVFDIRGRRVVQQPEPLPFDPDIDSIPDERPFSSDTTFNGTFSPTFDPETQTWGVWDNQRGTLVATGFTQSQADRDAVEFSNDGIVLTPEQNISPSANTTFNGTYSATFDPDSQSWGVWNDQTGAFVVTGLTQAQAERDALEFTEGDFRPTAPIPNAAQTQTSAIQAVGERQNATVALARQQQSIREQRGQQNQGDWRVKLRLAPGADYLYKADSPGILWPLVETDGVIFPYTPRIDTSYRAVYDAIDLTHSNYRGYFYRSSYADFVQVSSAFTAQDTFEAEYLLAVITFFKSLTKMFYGQDSQRGSPPPLVYLTGLGEYQFSEHPCVVTQFNYNLPDNVDYIRARIANVNATNLLTRRNPKNAPTNPITSAIQRLASLGQGIKPGALNSPPPPPILGKNNPTYVPTRIDISLQLLPMQSRRQISQQFSLKNFANGNLIKGGFW